MSKETGGEYPKIETLFDRDPTTFKVIEGKWRLPEFEYLRNNDWLITEKVDGTNTRVMWDGSNVHFGGRTDDAQMPTFLLARLQELFTAEKLVLAFPLAPPTPNDGPTSEEVFSVCLYGEGYGARIQKGGGNYKADGVDFVLFDVRVGKWWLKWPDVQGVASKLSIRTVPAIATGALQDAVTLVKRGLTSAWGEFDAEGVVVRPTVDLRSRAGHRILGKLKAKDF